MRDWTRFQTKHSGPKQSSVLEQLVCGGQMEVMQRADVQTLSSVGGRRTGFYLSV